MVLLIACCAAEVMESASSKITSLCCPARKLTRFLANILILSRTTAMPRSSEAFNSMTASLAKGPSNCRARHSIVVVLPVPGGPLKMMLGMLPPFTTACNFATVSSLPTTSFKAWGRYFSTQGWVDMAPGQARGLQRRRRRDSGGDHVRWAGTAVAGRDPRPRSGLCAARARFVRCFLKTCGLNGFSPQNPTASLSIVLLGRAQLTGHRLVTAIPA